MITRKVSFLSQLDSSTYNAIQNLKGIAIIYTIVLCIIIPLSLYFHNGFIKFFIDCMLGWTLLSIPYMAVIVVTLDKQVEIEVKESEYTWFGSSKQKVEFPKSYVYTKIWGITLCILAVIALYFSNKYKKYYAFQCEEFYLETTTGVYHIFDDCDYIGQTDDEEYVDDINVEEIKGVDLLNSNYSLCDACEERAEDYEMEASDWMYRRK